MQSILKKGNLLQLMINYGRGKRTGKENCFNFKGMVRLRHNYKLVSSRNVYIFDDSSRMYKMAVH